MALGSFIQLYTHLVFSIIIAIFVTVAIQIAMSKEILEISILIDEQFDF